MKEMHDINDLVYFVNKKRIRKSFKNPRIQYKLVHLYGLEP